MAHASVLAPLWHFTVLAAVRFVRAVAFEYGAEMRIRVAALSPVAGAIEAVIFPEEDHFASPAPVRRSRPTTHLLRLCEAGKGKYIHPWRASTYSLPVDSKKLLACVLQSGGLTPAGASTRVGSSATGILSGTAEPRSRA